MRRHSRGQSVVEMAFVLPVLVLILFGIIELSYYVYGYATIYQAARNGAEKASEIPPYSKMIDPSLNTSDLCVSTILKRVQEGAVLFPDLTTTNVNQKVKITYPDGGNRALGSSIQVEITYNLVPLTPIWKFVTLGNQGTMRIQTVSRRSIESLGNNPNKTYAPNLVACKEN